MKNARKNNPDGTGRVTSFFISDENIPAFERLKAELDTHKISLGKLIMYLAPQIVDLLEQLSESRLKFKEFEFVITLKRREH